MSDIKWNQKKHDQQLQQEQADKQKAKALKIAGDIWQRWKKSLCSKPRTKKEIITGLYELRDAIGKAIDREDLSDWKEFTLNMVSDKIAQLVKAEIADSNRITEYVPEWASAKPHEADFHSREEFEGIPFIADFKSQNGFIGFARAYPNMYAIFAGEEPLLIGKIGTEFALTEYPTLAEFQSEMAKALMPSAEFNPFDPGTPDTKLGPTTAKSALAHPDATSTGSTSGDTPSKA